MSTGDPLERQSYRRRFRLRLANALGGFRERRRIKRRLKTYAGKPRRRRRRK